MSASHQRDFPQKLRALLLFNELFFIFFLIYRHKRAHLNPGPVAAIQPAPSPQPTTIQEKKKVLGHALDPSKRRKRKLQQPPGRLISQVFDFIEEHIHHRIKKEVTNFRKPLEVVLKLAMTLRYPATGETYKSLQCHWLDGQTTMRKFVPIVCQSILAEFQKEF